MSKKFDPAIMYMWFKLYRKSIKDDIAKWDFLNHIRKQIRLDLKDEEFFKKYAKENGLDFEVKS